MAAPIIPRGMENPNDLYVKMSFYQDNIDTDNETPYLYLLPKHPELPLSNCRFSSEALTKVHNCRAPGYENDFELNGFAFVHAPLRQHNLVSTALPGDPSEELLVYLQELRGVVQNYLCADEAIVFDWRFRRSCRQDQVDGFDEDGMGRGEFIRPAYKAHADLSPAAGWVTLKLYLSEAEFAKVESGHWRARIITCWRPLVPIVLDCPLAICYRGTVSDQDCVPYDRVDGSSGGGQGMFMKYNTQQRWGWLSRQTCNEVSLIESWDSRGEGYTGKVPILRPSTASTTSTINLKS